MGLILRGLILLPLLFSAQIAYSQVDPFNTPWILVGDSLKFEPKKIVILTGHITELNSNEAVQGASVSVDMYKHFDHTDAQGNYLLLLPAGKYRLTIHHVGMKNIYRRIKVFTTGAFDIAMEEGVTGLEEVVITARPIDSNVKESIGGLAKFNVQEIKTLPTMLGEVDIVKSLQLLPGVSSVGEGSSGFNVRGGRVDQNLILLNGTPLFNSSHALGFVSAFNQDIIKDFSLYKGNVPANFGGRAASVLDVSTRKGDFDKWHYQGGVGIVSSRFTAEGPLSKGKTSLLAAGRISYADWLLKQTSNPDVKNSSLFFFDGYAQVSHRFSPRSSADFSVYSSHDNFKFSQQFGYQWSNLLVNLKWQSLTDKKLSPVFSAAYGKYKSNLVDPSGMDASTLQNTMNYFQLKEYINYNPNDNHNSVGGIEVMGYLPRPEQLLPYNNSPSIAPKSNDKNHGLEFSAFANDDVKLGEKLSISIGLRYSFYQHIGPDTVYKYSTAVSKSVDSIVDTAYYSTNQSIKAFGGLEPRISTRVNITENQSIKASYNRMRQYIHLISNTTAPTPVDIWQVSNEYLPPQISDNFSLGYFLNLKDNAWETSAEVFYKGMQNLVEYKNFPTLYLNHHIETELISGQGRAYGGELYIRRLKGLWTGWLSYTYSITESKVSSPFASESINEGQWYPSNYNKPHTLNLVANKRTLRGGAVSFIFTYTSGRPMTAIESSYITQGVVVPVYSERNKYHIPDYIRLDLSFTFPSVFKKIDDSLVFSVYNLLGRENAYSIFYQRPSSTFLIPKAYQLSILGSALPSLTYNFRF